MRFARLFVLLSIFSLVSCNKTRDFSDHKNREYSTYYDRFLLNDLNDFYNQDSDLYIIYMYGSTCEPCTKIKGVILDYLDEIIDGTCTYVTDFYIYERELDPNYSSGAWSSYYFKPLPENATSIRNTLITEMLGATSLSETYFFGTPSLYIIKDHSLDNLILGSSSCGDYIYRYL